MGTTTKKCKATVDSVTIRPIPSEYTTGAWSRVEARITFWFRTFVSILEERSAAAVGHRLAANALEATPAAERWCISTEVGTSYRDVVQVNVAVELSDGSADEMERAKALLAEITARLK